MSYPLLEKIHQYKESNQNSGAILGYFLDFVRDSGRELYPEQEDAIIAVFDDHNVILNTPTGSGKSLVATALHFWSVCSNRKSVYTSPIKALVNEKFLQLSREFGPELVGLATGDASVNQDAPILCCTAEILAQMALRLGEKTPYQDVVMDEFHYYSDRERGIAWQIPLLTLSKSRFLLMSATLGDTLFFEKSLTDLNRKTTDLVKSTNRPVPLEFEYRETFLHESIEDLIRRDLAPIYVVNFTQRECAEVAQNLLSSDHSSKEEKKRISEFIQGQNFKSPYGQDLQRLLKHGIGIHHAGLLPKYRLLVEKLAQKGFLKVICGTDTLGVGVNVPIRSVLMNKLCKFDGQKTTILSVRDFHQLAGRAGRKGFDTLGKVLVQAPEHVVENLKAEQKAASDPKKAKKWVKKTPPQFGYVPWNKDTFLKLVNGSPEPLRSQFNIHHGIILNVLSRPHPEGCRALRNLLKTCHESRASKKKLRHRTSELFRTLRDRKIIEIDRNRLKLNADLQEDFSLNHALSLYLVDTLALLNPQSEDYALDVLTLAESIAENPEVILRKQVDKAKTLRMQELKAAGMEYEERIEELEKVEHPKPNRDFIYETFNSFASAHPWVGEDNIRPKSIAREMYVNFMSFADYIKEYNLERAEGVLLRYLTDIYKMLTQTVPEQLKNEAVFEIEAFLESLVRTTDSSLLEEWEKMGTPVVETKRIQTPDTPSLFEQNKARLRTLRNLSFQFVAWLGKRNWPAFLEALQVKEDQEGQVWSERRIEEHLNAFESSHSKLLLTNKSRHSEHLITEAIAGGFLVTQKLPDSEQLYESYLKFKVQYEEGNVIPSFQLLEWRI